MMKDEEEKEKTSVVVVAMATFFVIVVVGGVGGVVVVVVYFLAFPAELGALDVDDWAPAPLMLDVVMPPRPVVVSAAVRGGVTGRPAFMPPYWYLAFFSLGLSI